MESASFRNKKIRAKDISSLKPASKAYDRWIEGTSGLLVRVYPTGTKSYVLQFARKKRKTLGKVGMLPFPAAKRQAESLMRLRDEIKADRAVGEALLKSKQSSKRAKLEAARSALSRNPVNPETVTLRAFLKHYYEQPRYQEKLRPKIQKDIDTQLLQTYRKSESKRIQGQFADILDLPIVDISGPRIVEWANQGEENLLKAALVVR